MGQEFRLLTGKGMQRNVYAGIFVEEPGQQLLNHSMAQIQATLGTAWNACESKENRLDVFGRCMDLVDTWNEKTFAEESQAVFEGLPRSNECWRAAFSAYVRQVYRGSKSQVRATVPNGPAYVQALITAASKHPVVRSGKYFEFESSLERKDVAMDVVRQSIATLCNEFVYEEEAAPTVVDAVPADISPDDSASQVGIKAYRAAPSQTHSSQVSHESTTSVERPPPPEHKSVTIVAHTNEKQISEQ